jgi:hypothetical protein
MTKCVLVSLDWDDQTIAIRWPDGIPLIAKACELEVDLSPLLPGGGASQENAVMDPQDAFRPSSPYWGCGVSPAARIVPRITSELERLRAFAETFARCPCCEELRECAPGCTYHDDCLDVGIVTDYDRMIAARAALWGE